jgi:hypothetical protein
MTRDDIAQMMQDAAGADWGTEAHFQRFATLIIKRQNKDYTEWKRRDRKEKRERYARDKAARSEICFLPLKT